MDAAIIEKYCNFSLATPPPPSLAFIAHHSDGGSQSGPSLTLMLIPSIHRVYFIHLKSLLQNFVSSIRRIAQYQPRGRMQMAHTQARFNLHNRWQTESERFH